MKLTSKQMAALLGMTNRGFAKLVKNLQLPHTQDQNKFIFDLNCTIPKYHDFFQSVIQAMHNPHLRVFYSLKNLADLYQKDKKTIKTLLIENDVKMYQNGRKLIVLLVDLQRFRELLRK